jgi:hypothetical protein
MQDLFRGDHYQSFFLRELFGFASYCFGMQVLANNTAMELGCGNNQDRLTLGQTVSRYTRLVSVCNFQKAVNGVPASVPSKVAVQQVDVTNPVACWLML